MTIPAREVVPGDVVLLAAGSLVPADAIVLEATDCFVNESVLTGESFPVEKTPGVVARASVLTERTNCVFLGTNVRSGTARCLVVATGTATQFGAIAQRLTLRPPETEFDRGTPSVRLSPDQRHARHGARGVRGEHVPRAARRSRRCCSPSRWRWA